MSRDNTVLALCGIGFYRKSFVAQLLAQHNGAIQIYAGDNYKKEFIPLLNENFLEIRSCRVLKMPKGFLFVFFPFFRILSAKVLILDFNPRALHVVPLIIVRRLLGKRTLLWGHAFSRSGRNQKSELLRKLLRRITSGLIVYTESEKRQVNLEMPFPPVFSAPNSLYPQDSMNFVPNSDRWRILFVGRLIPEKKPFLLLEAFSSNAKLKDVFTLTFVGDGPLLGRLQSKVSQLGLANRVEFLGHIEEMDQLSKIYGETLVSVSPGYVGLSLTQSTGFGVPMLVAADERHAPEIEGFLEGFNGLKFCSDNAKSLEHALLQISKKGDYWNSVGEDISLRTRQKYSTEVMVQGFLEAIDHVRK